MSASQAKNKPDFIIIGAMKSATSSLQDQLSHLPGVFMTTPKEPNFFSNDSIYARGESWYSSLYDKACNTDLKGEASTHYTKLPKYPETVARLSAYCPEAKFIYVMRHPIDRLISHFLHNWTMGFIPRGANIEDLINSYPPLVEYGLYNKQLEPWLAKFGRERVLPVFFDRLIASPQSELERICHFLGYTKPPQWKNDIDASNVTSERHRRIPFQKALIDSKISQLLRRSLLPKSVRDALRAKLPATEKPELSSQCLEALEQVFNKDLQALGQLLDVSLTCSNFKEVTAEKSFDWAKPPN